MINKCFIPFPKLETERLLLREVESTDVNQVFNILSDPKVAEYEYFYPVKTKEEANKFITRYKAELKDKEEITWGTIVKETDELVGMCCIGDFNEGARRCVIGYQIKQIEWGKGYATEAVAAIIDYGFNVMNINRIEAAITPGNDASVRVLEKLNFVKEGLLRERDLMKGKLEDGIIMSMLKREYKIVK
ncbi:GNAT family N-acetyltransferase [Alkaliphilus pronyensis]|uniref:GNAT family N-acetyltransferase n=1 Tax=Alkaliphilus pronyensis TaxID=1482732 RepID=A0A6I0F327_9FIRM|nr:GNAT family protein [Alkaliphilus pronyensis]KAB3537291.1 GNAT family N-acetyltransferase [Alkaliphilus pronyensis]